MRVSTGQQSTHIRSGSKALETINANYLRLFMEMHPNGANRNIKRIKNKLYIPFMRQSGTKMKFSAEITSNAFRKHIRPKSAERISMHSPSVSFVRANHVVPQQIPLPPAHRQFRQQSPPACLPAYGHKIRHRIPAGTHAD